MDPYSTLESLGINGKDKDGNCRYYTDILDDIAILWQKMGD